MTIEIQGKQVELKYSFNSFKYMAELNLSELSELEEKPFKVIPITEQLLFGAVNNNPSVIITVDSVQTYLEGVLEKGELFDLVEQLIELLQASDFFKSLQVTKKPTKKAK